MRQMLQNVAFPSEKLSLYPNFRTDFDCKSFEMATLVVARGACVSYISSSESLCKVWVTDISQMLQTGDLHLSSSLFSGVTSAL